MNSTPESPNNKEIVMSQTKQERNKALVLEAFDTLFVASDKASFITGASIVVAGGKLAR